MTAPEIKKNSILYFFCLLHVFKHTIPEVTAFRCHQGHGYLSQFSDNIPSQVFAPRNNVAVLAWN